MATEKSRKQAIAAAMWTVMEELSREENDLYAQAYKVSRTKADMAEAWDRLDLGPLPDPEVMKGNAIGPTPNEFDEEVGMTERIRAILKGANGMLEPTHVRDALVRTGFNLEGRSNPMAEIHTVLKRLAEKNKRVITKEVEGVVYYGFDVEVPSAKKRPRQ